MNRCAVVVVLLVTLAGLAASAAPPPDLAPFAFLLGEWASEGGGRPGSGTGTAVFSRDLQDRVILRKSYAEYPASEGKPASRHDDLLVIYVAPAGGVRADYYDSEGHLIGYTVTSPAAGEAVLVSSPSPRPDRRRRSSRT
jgi:hypothetical protein